MSTSRRIAVLTGSRAEFGLLLPVVEALGASDFDVPLVVTGAHLTSSSASRAEIRAAGIVPAAEVPMVLADDSGVGVATSIGVGTIGVAQVLERLRPDMLVMLGDRYELLAAAAAATVMGIPIGHLSGGDLTIGAYDDSIRHAVSKLSHLHFTSTRQAADRLLQLGEEPWRVHCVGSPGLDRLISMPSSPRHEAAAELGLDPDSPWILATFHPVTRDSMSSADQLKALFAALQPLIDQGWQLLFTGANADNDGQHLNALIKEWSRTREGVRFEESLGFRRYAMALAHVRVVVGNSSSGLTEAPSLQVPTVNIGTRQEGRVRGASVLDTPPDANSIAAAIARALELDVTGISSPYGDGAAAMRIARILADVPDFPALLIKRFQDHARPA